MSLMLCSDVSVVALVEQVVVVSAAAITSGADLAVLDKEVENLLSTHEVGNVTEGLVGSPSVTELAVAVVSVTILSVNEREVITRGNEIGTVVVTVADYCVDEGLHLVTSNVVRVGCDKRSTTGLTGALSLNSVVDSARDDATTDVELLVVGTDKDVVHLGVVTLSDTEVDETAANETLQFVELKVHKAWVFKVKLIANGNVRGSLSKLDLVVVTGSLVTNSHRLRQVVVAVLTVVGVGPPSDSVGATLLLYVVVTSDEVTLAVSKDTVPLILLSDFGSGDVALVEDKRVVLVVIGVLIENVLPRKFAGFNTVEQAAFVVVVEVVLTGTAVTAEDDVSGAVGKELIGDHQVELGHETTYFLGMGWRELIEEPKPSAL